MSTQSDLTIHPPLFIPSYDRNGVSNDRDWPAATIPLSARSLYLPSFYLSLSRMSTSSTGKTVNYNQQEAATTTCEREIFRSTDRGWRDARERTEDTGKGRKGKGKTERSKTERNGMKRSRAAQRSAHHHGRNPTSSALPPSLALVFVRVFIRVLPGAETAEY